MLKVEKGLRLQIHTAMHEVLIISLLFLVWEPSLGFRAPPRYISWARLFASPETEIAIESENKLISLGLASWELAKRDRDGSDDRNEKMVLKLKEGDLTENFIRSAGKGGQKVNKSSSRVHLIHKPSGIQVFCQDARDLSTNRVRARKYLIDKLDAHYNEDESKYAKAQEKIRKRKSSSKRKAKKKYEGGKEGKEEEDEDEDGEDDLSFEEQLLLEKRLGS